MEKIKSPAYSTIYVQNICDETTSKQEGTASFTVNKNNWLHLGTKFFIHLVKNTGFGFLLVIK